ncbi:MAG: FAD-dependent oxidoreductase [Pseudomonadota bacterium]
MDSILILGAGASGLSTALALLKRGHRVSLIERGTAGGESTWAGGGILSPLLPWDYPEPVSRLALASMQAYAAWVGAIEQLSADTAEFWRCGMRVMGLASSREALDWCVAHGLHAEIPPGHPDSLWLPDIAQARNPRLASVLGTAVLRSGGALHRHTAGERAIVVAGHVVAIEAGGERHEADRFVLCTGAWAGLGLEGLPGVPNIRPIRGQMLLFKLEPGVLDTILFRNGLYIIPRRDGHILVGSTLEDAGFDKSTDAATASRLQAEAAELLPVLAAAAPVRHWAGLRPGSPDNIPVIGRHPDFDNVYINAGHYRYGVTMAPASAELLADLMTGKAPALDPTPYSWEAAATRRWNGTR